MAMICGTAIRSIRWIRSCSIHDKFILKISSLMLSGWWNVNVDTGWVLARTHTKALTKTQLEWFMCYEVEKIHTFFSCSHSFFSLWCQYVAEIPHNRNKKKFHSSSLVCSLNHKLSHENKDALLCRFLKLRKSFFLY
jgi:hypothetical protein